MHKFHNHILRFIVLLCISGLSFTVIQADSEYIIDHAGILGIEETDKLNAYAEEISREYDCGIYAVTITSHSGDVQDMADDMYHNQYHLGYGEEKNGIMLLLSMEDRDYALLVNGEKAQNVFQYTDDLKKAFLDDFKEDNYQSGIQEYLETCGWYLEQASLGKPVKPSVWSSFFIILGISAGIAGIITWILYKMNKNVRKAVKADAYAAGTASVSNSYDQYMHTTTTSRTIQRNTSGNGSSIQSGKF